MYVSVAKNNWFFRYWDS